MNLDPRSATLNTEFGALIDGPALALQLQTLIDIDRRLVLSLEPDSHSWMRWLGSLLQRLAPEDHL